MGAADGSAIERVAEASARLRSARDPDSAADALRDALALLPPDAPEAVKAELAGIAELALERARLVRTRESLLASISHDLRNPLNTFAMSAGLLRDDVERGELDRARAASLLQRMERAVERMQRLIEDLSEAGRIDAGRVELARKPESAEKLVRDAIAASASVAAERSGVLEPGELDAEARVLGDRARLVQAFTKLVAYALRITGDGAHVRIGAKRRDDRVVFVVTAHPAGGASFTPPEEGRGGLNLLLARGLVELHGGTLLVESSDHLLVTITLPAAA